PHCGATDRLNRLEGVRTKPSKANPEGVLRHGLWKCYHCRNQFTVRKGTIFEDSHLPLTQWFQAAFLMCSSKKGVSANQLHRTLGITLKSAWFMAMRLREAMREGPLATPFGQGGGAVEADETYIGRWRRKRDGERGHHHKIPVFTLIDRDSKKARSVVMPVVTSIIVGEVVAENVSREARLMTDEATVYNSAHKHVAAHETVNHRKEEYVRGETYTNSAENYFSVFKKGMKGIYQHCSERHLHRYLAEFDFRYNHRIANGVDDVTRTTHALAGAKGEAAHVSGCSLRRQRPSMRRISFRFRFDIKRES
ncbi:MAG: IS1595 family transposase, partial [Alphaproteobacteria bacterium]|nr:IS1595 family transposase [Alphaproteobacteria bacterium]